MTQTVVREPLFRRAPSWRQSFGDLAARVGVELGLPPDDEQRSALDVIFAERAPGEPAARHAAIIGARQQIKTSTLIVAAATDLLVLGIPGAIWTAHESKTSTKAYEDLLGRLLRHEDYAQLVDYRGGRGEERIFLADDTAVSLEYRARSSGSGRGFTTSRLTLDEALFLRAGDMGALMPTMLTRRDAQVRYGSSGGFRTSEVLRSLRQRAHDGSDPRLFYVEYGAERRPCTMDGCTHAYGLAEGCALDDRELWWQSCSALWCGRVTEENVEDLRRSMPPEEFMREVLVWWDEPLNVAGGDLDLDRWLELADPEAERGERPVFGVDVAEDRTASVAVVWRRPDGAVQVMLADPALSPLRLAARVEELRERWHGRVMTGGAAADLDVPDGDVVSGPQFASACGRFADLLDEGTLRHGAQPALDDAVRVARWRHVGSAGERAFVLRDQPVVGRLAAVARALHGLFDAELADYFTI